MLRQLSAAWKTTTSSGTTLPIGPRARQPDFVVLSPRWGVLLLRGQHWKRSTLRGATRDSVTLATERGPGDRGQSAAPVRATTRWNWSI